MKIAKRHKSFIAAGAIVGVALIGMLAIAVGPGSTEAESIVSQSNVTAGESSSDLAESGLGPTVMPSLMKMAGALVVVIICIYGALFLLKKLMGQKYSRNGRTDVVEVIQTIHLSPRQTVSLIRVADRAVLIGACENSITPLTEIDPLVMADLLSESEEQGNGERARGFLDTAWFNIRKGNVPSSGRSDRVEV